MILKTYFLGNKPVAIRQGGRLRYLHADHLGSTSLLTGDRGQLIAATGQRYMPYGKGRARQAAPLPSERAFTGQLLDTSTGLMYYGARYYDSSLGRFTQPDTIVPQPGNPQSLNRFSYALNNPLRYTDPTGHAVALDDWAGSPSPVVLYALNLENSRAVIADWLDQNPGYNPASDPILAGSTWAGPIDLGVSRNLITQDYGAWAIDAGTASGKPNPQAIDIFGAGVAGLVINVGPGEGIGGNRGANPFGQPGKPDHQATVARLKAMAEEEFQGRDVAIQESKSIKQWLGIDRRPDVSVVDRQTGELLKVYEAARLNSKGNFVPREQQKMLEYRRENILHWFEAVK